MQTGKKRRSKKHAQKTHARIAILVVFIGSCLFYLGSRFFVGSKSNELSAQNQKVQLEIDQKSAAINRLEDEITELQEKNRVLGMLEGQVSDNGGNVYYYDAE